MRWWGGAHLTINSVFFPTAHMAYLHIWRRLVVTDTYTHTHTHTDALTQAARRAAGEWTKLEKARTLCENSTTILLPVELNESTTSRSSQYFFHDERLSSDRILCLFRTECVCWNFPTILLHWLFGTTAPRIIITTMIYMRDVGCHR